MIDFIDYKKVTFERNNGLQTKTQCKLCKYYYKRHGEVGFLMLFLFLSSSTYVFP